MGVTPASPNPPAPGAVVSDETFSASRWTKGNLWFPTRIVVSPLRVSRVKRRLFSRSERKHFDFPGSVGEDFDGSLLVGYPDRVDGRHRSDHESWPPQGRRIAHPRFD
jgi:hypothetical protein